MGCALSKEVESTSSSLKETSSWDKAIYRRFTIQINRSLRRTSDGSYIAAIFSANYGILRKHANVKPLGSKVLLGDSSQTESYPTHPKCPMVKSDANAHTNLVEDNMLVVPISSIKNAADSLEAPKSAESTKEILESVNILELMEGLAEEDVSANFENLLESSSNLLLPEAKQGSSTLVPCKPIDKMYASEAVSANKRARNQRPKSLSAISSIASVEDVDTALSARRGMTLSPLMISREACQHKKKMNAAPVGQTILDHNIHPHDDDVVISIPECTSVTAIEDPSIGNAETLQTVISFKCIFNHTSSDIGNSANTDLGALGTLVHEATPTLCRSDSLVFATARLYEGESTSSPSSPQFSTTTSLDDWLPSCNHPSTPANRLLCDGESSISATLHILPSPREAAQFCHASCLESLCIERASNQLPNLQYQDGPELEDYEIPVFDPEMIDSFENAIRLLSKEEWDAVRGIEDSPRNFLRLVKALKRSRSNSVCSPKEKAANLGIETVKLNSNAGKDAKDCCVPWKFPYSKSEYAEKTRAFMRQNSLDIGKACYQVRARDDKGTDHVVFYSSTAPAGSKAYKDCNQVRSILLSLVGISYKEKSVSECEEDEQELRHALNISVAVVPTIYVKGKYLVGIDNILHLYNRGFLGSMLREAGGL